jgi:hypothetical protein
MSYLVPQGRQFVAQHVSAGLAYARNQSPSGTTQLLQPVQSQDLREFLFESFSFVVFVLILDVCNSRIHNELTSLRDLVPC